MIKNHDSEQGNAAVVIDMDSVDENAGGFEAIPRGTYPVVVDDLEFTYSQNSGNPMWTWKLKIESGEFADRVLFFHTSFTPKMQPRLKSILQRVAPDLARGALNPQQVAEDGLMLGLRAQARVDVRMYEGQRRNNVKDLLAPKAEEGGFM